MNRTHDRLTGVTCAVLLQMGLVVIFIYSLPLIAPARVPCVELRTRTLGFNGIQDTGIMTDPLCILNGWINGFGGLPP